MTARSRLDSELVRRGLVASPEAAAGAVAAGRVLVAGAVASKTSSLVARSDPIVLSRPTRHWASRGGEKLDPALRRLGVEVTGLRCLDAGASTGGFTDVLLERGASSVVAVDVGYGQLVPRLAVDPRVRVLDRTNVRNLTAGQIGGPVDLVVADLSFIPLTVVLSALAGATTAAGELVLLVKPQFEAPRAAVEAGGVVRDAAARAAAVSAVAARAAALGFGVAGLCPSAAPGPAGNVELFLHLARDGGRIDPEVVAAAVREGARLPGALS